MQTTAPDTFVSIMQYRTRSGEVRDIAPVLVDNLRERADAAAARVRQWAPHPADEPGPRQLKALKEAFGALYNKRGCKRELSGDLSKLEGFDRKEGFGDLYMVELFGAPNRWPEPLEALAEIGERYAWTVRRSNAAEITAALERARAALDWETLPIEDARRSPEELRRIAEAVAANEARAKAAAEAEEASAARIAALRPAWAAAAIVAEHREDESDIVTDYFGSRSTRRVLIGWRRGAREDFRQLRAAAAMFEPTAHLADAPANAEHRENWSMGAGNFLKVGGKHCTGWGVSSRSIGPHIGDMEIAEHLTAPAPEAAAPVPITGTGYTIQEGQNKRGKIALVVLSERVERTAWERLTESARRAGGWYSRAWGAQPGGWGFPDETSAAAWAAGEFGSR